MAIIQNLSVEQLKKALHISEQIEALQAQLAEVLGGAEVETTFAAEAAPVKVRRNARGGKGKSGKGGMSPEGRARIAAAQRARWAKSKGGEVAEASVAVGDEASTDKPKRTMSPEARAKVAAAARKRWRKAKAAGKNRL